MQPPVCRARRSSRPSRALAARSARGSPPAVLRVLGLSAYLACVMTGCSVASQAAPDGSAASDTRDAESVLNVYNWGEYMDPQVIQEFEKEFGIKVNYDVYDSNELLETRLLVGHTN